MSYKIGYQGETKYYLVGVHSKMNNNVHPMDSAHVGVSSLWPFNTKFINICFPSGNSHININFTLILNIIYVTFTSIIIHTL